MSHFFLPSVFVASLRPENMAAVLYGCGGQSQTKCQLGHIVVGHKKPPVERSVSSQGALWDNMDAANGAAQQEKKDQRG